MNSLFLDYSVTEIVKKLSQKDISCVEVASTTAKNIAETESKTKAWVGFDPTSLLADAFIADERYALGNQRVIEGIPFGVKDIFNTRAFPTQMGSAVWKGFTPGNNARVVDSIAYSGGIVAGKTVTAEFAVHALNETMNPHDPTRTPGTSSSGSAAAVAVGMVPFALASQTAGSIVRPASFCGVWGMKPSFGIIPRTGVLKTTDSLDTIGFVASRAHTLRTVLDICRVKGPDYPYVYQNVDSRGTSPKPASRPWKVGFVKTHVWDRAEFYAKVAVEGFVQNLGNEPRFEIEEITWPTLLDSSHLVHETIYNKSLSYYFQREARELEQISPIMAEMIAAGQAISPESFRSALLQQEDICQLLDQLIKDYDFVVSLGTSGSAPLRGQEELPDPSLIWTLGHIPSVVSPCFRDPQGLPFGVQLISRKWNDYLLLQAVEELVEHGILPWGSMPLVS